MNKKEYVKLRIETKLIGKIAHHRLMARKTFRHRHIGDFPDINRSQCMHHVNELRVWLKMAYLIDQANRYRALSKKWGLQYPIKSPTLNPNIPAEPYETYYAKELTK